jgi:hypothetical protein
VESGLVVKRRMSLMDEQPNHVPTDIVEMLQQIPPLRPYPNRLLKGYHRTSGLPLLYSIAGPNALAGLETALRRATRLQIASVIDVQSMSEVGEYGRGFERMSNEGGIGVREIETVARCRKLSPPKVPTLSGFPVRVP